ncbi:MAG: SlyX family protein [Pirellulaceae bacterium]
MTARQRTDDLIVQLQETVSFQQRAIDQLNEVITQIRLELDQANLRLEKHEARLKYLAETQTVDEVPDERPPHY